MSESTHDDPAIYRLQDQAEALVNAIIAVENQVEEFKVALEAVTGLQLTPIDELTPPE